MDGMTREEILGLEIQQITFDRGKLAGMMNGREIVLTFFDPTKISQINNVHNTNGLIERIKEVIPDIRISENPKDPQIIEWIESMRFQF